MSIPPLRKRQKRHRNPCRYFRTKQGCHRKEYFQYLHDSIINDDKRKEKQSNDKEGKCDNSFECNHCDFMYMKLITMKKHKNTKHTGHFSEDLVSEFIFHLGCEDYASEYKTYFNEYGFSKKETNYVKRIIKLYGLGYILEDL